MSPMTPSEYFSGGLSVSIIKMAALETLTQHLPGAFCVQALRQALEIQRGGLQCLPSMRKDRQLIHTCHAAQQGGTRVLRKHRGEESPNSKALPREGDIRAVLRPDRHQPGKQDGMEKWWTVDWESSLKTVIHPENSMDGWNSGICEEIQLEKKAGATPWWAWHAKLKKFNFSWSKEGPWKFIKWGKGIA